MPRRTGESGQSWATFLQNHSPRIWACDFTIAHDLLFRPLYIFVFIELQTRRIIHVNVTAAPHDPWVAQQLREATAWDRHPDYLIHDRDNKYGSQFSNLATHTGINELVTPYQAPKANAFCERFIGSLRRECLDHELVLGREQLQRVVAAYIDYYNRSRPHQGIEQRMPTFFHYSPERPTGKVTSVPILGGLHHSYSRAAYLH
ncbi:MAG: integrase core domain-containing protein [Anaerolineales bacterium]